MYVSLCKYFIIYPKMYIYATKIKLYKIMISSPKCLLNKLFFVGLTCNSCCFSYLYINCSPIMSGTFYMTVINISGHLIGFV